MEDFVAWLAKLNSNTVIVILILVVLATALIKIKGITEIITFIFKRKISRTCSDCILILFGISEKYKTQYEKFERGILKAQMSYFEQKSQELTLYLIRSFQDDIELLANGRPQSLKISQFANYQEALKNSMSAVKDEIRKAFKENGFIDMEDIEFSSYVKSKLKTLTSIAQTYLSTFYPQTDETIVTLKYRYDKLDMSRLSEMAFDIFNNARAIARDARSHEKELQKTFETDIDSFVSGDGKD